MALSVADDKRGRKAPTASVGGMRILVVDDEVELAEAVARGLRREGYAVDLAHDGESALDKAALTPYDLVCLDLTMPGIDGLEVCRRLREDPPGEGDPPRVLMLTARDSIDDRIAGLDHGADGVAETLGVLDDAGLGHTGSARDPEERFDGIWIEPDGVKVAHLSYSYGFNGFSVPSDMPWLANRIDEEQILDDADRARREGAGYVVLSLHWGEQYQHTPNRQQRVQTRQRASATALRGTPKPPKRRILA